MAAEPVAGFVLAALAIGAAGWLSWRRPTVLLAIALASLSVRPQLFAGGAPVGYEWGLHHTLLLLAQVANALHFGIRRTMYWPFAGLLAAFALSVAAGDLHPKLTPSLLLMSLGVFALPWVCTSVVLEPGSRRVLALVIMLTPLLSVAIGAFMTAAGIHSSFPRWHRLHGATGNAATFAILAFAGFIAALHEMARLFSPLFDRGVGAGFVAAADWLNRPRTTRHNEYLHLLVNVGVIGFVLCATAIGLWYRRLLQMASEYDRSFLIALLPAMGLFAITEDVLVLSTGLATFACLGVLLTKRSAITSVPRAGRRHRSRCARRALREGIALAPARIRNGSGL